MNGRLVGDGSPAPALRFTSLPWRIGLTTAALCLAVASQRLAGEDLLMEHPLAAPLVFAAAVVLVLAATRSGTRAQEPSVEPAWPAWERLLLLALLVLALLLRVVRTGEIPPALTGDEASAGLAAVGILEGRLDNPFTVSWYSFPALYFSIPAASIAVVGRSFEALRIPSAIAGALTVAGLYLLARSMWGRRTAVLSAALLAVLHFHVHFSRIGLNNIWDGLLAVLTLGLFWRGWATGRRAFFVAAGVALGASQYFYASGRLLPAILIAWLALLVVFDRALPRSRLPDLVAMAVVALVVLLPLGIFFFHHPDEFAAPMNRVKILGPWLEDTVRTTGDPAWRVLLRNFRDAASGFSFGELQHWYRPGTPILLPPSALLFHAGLVLALIRIRDSRPRLVLLWLAGVLAAGGLSESAPASQRYVLGAPAAVLLASWALASMTEAAERRWPRIRPATLGAVALFLAASTALDLDLYFRRYVRSGAALDANTEVAGTLAARLREETAGSRVYFFGPPRMGFASIETLPFLVPHVAPTDVDTPLTGPPAWPLEGRKAFFVLLPERKAELLWVRASHPEGREEEFTGWNGDPLFTAWVVPASGTR